MVFNIEKKSEQSQSLHVQPVFSVIKEVIFSINSKKEWVKVTSLGKEDFGKNSYDISLLTLLESPYKGLKDKISKALYENKMDQSLVKSFPFNLVVLSGLKSGSEYWIQLAMSWLKVNKSLITGEISNFLKSISDNKKYSQKVRHAAMKINREDNIGY